MPVTQNSSTPPNQNQSGKSGPSGPSGIAGWMLIPLAGMAITVGLNGLTLVGAARDFASYIEILGSDIDMNVKIAIAGSLTSGLLLVLTAVITLYLVFSKRRWAARSAILHYAFLICAMGFQLWASMVVSNDTSLAGSAEALRAVILVSIGAILWIVYFVRSRRVKNTFIH